MGLRLNVMATDTVTGLKIDTEMAVSFFLLGLSVVKKFTANKLLVG